MAIRRVDDSINAHLALRIAVKAINDTMGPDEIVHSLLLYHLLPRFRDDKGSRLRVR